MVRPGFRVEAEELALEVRAELKLAPQTRLVPKDLAEHLGITVLGLRGLMPYEPEDDEGGITLAEAVDWLTGPSRDAISAFTVVADNRRLIVYNESHPETRQANSLAHELAHVLLEHDPSPHADEYGHRFWSPEIEEEANLLAAALLVPREGARILLESGRTEAQAARHFGVSPQLFLWRARQTGVLRQLAASASAPTEASS